MLFFVLDRFFVLGRFFVLDRFTALYGEQNTHIQSVNITLSMVNKNTHIQSVNITLSMVNKNTHILRVSIALYWEIKFYSCGDATGFVSTFEFASGKVEVIVRVCIG